MAKKQGFAPYISPDELAATIDALSGKNRVRNKTILLFSHRLGLRAKEIASLTVGDVVDSRTGQIKNTVRLLKHMTKGNKFREVFLVSDQLVKSLSDYLSELGNVDPSTPLFASQKGGAFTGNTMQRLIANLYRDANVRGSSHSGRRSFATNLLEKGVDIHAVQELLGHESISTTQVYLYSSPAKLRKAASLLD